MRRVDIPVIKFNSMKKNLITIAILVSMLVSLFVVNVLLEQQWRVEDGGPCTDSSECKFGVECTVSSADASFPRSTQEQFEKGLVAIQGTCGGSMFGCIYTVEDGFISKKGPILCADPAF